MHANRGRILTTHAGSLPRPAELTRLYSARARGAPVDVSAIAEAGSSAVPWVVEKQIASGLDVVNNGEQQRESFVLYLRHRLSGLGGIGSRLPWADVEQFPEYKAQLGRQLAAKEAVSNRDQLPRCIGPVRYVGHAELATEIDTFREALKGRREKFVEPFFTAPSPGILASIVQNDHYATQEDYIRAVGEALAVEYRAIIDAGFLLQIDAPDLALECHGSFQHRPLRDFQVFVDLVVATLNDALTGIPRDRVRLHVCWGNYEGPHTCDVPLADILPILKKANVGAIFLPFANARHAHEIKIVGEQGLGSDQLLVAGVIDTLTNFVEHPETVADRIERAAAAMGDPARVQVAPDCGFDTSAGMGRVAEDVVWAKLRSLVEGAAIASSRLYG